ncbi:LCP family protein [Weissella ceti]|uniref:LCP family protein n=1 Tax=Weissella ceti TaxID=759620 RepID=A0ABT3E3J7_9LACO|nr:LCP family protein [Weissella ceti]MCW0952984.1 LCP family protein [Weissella ceti]QVK11529.1 LCP family protein [Weissella ceti]
MADEQSLRMERLDASRTAGKDNSPKKPKKPKKRWAKVVLITLLALLTLGIGASAYVYFQAKSAIDQSYQSADIQKVRDTDKALSDGKPVSILLLGTDTGELGREYKGRTDSMMLVTINPKTKETRMVSIPRDTLVSIPGANPPFPQKINAAYEVGSAGVAIETVQNWLNVPIDYYALVNMGGLEKVVDKIGGIQVVSPLTFDFNPDTARADAGNLYSFTQGSSSYSHTGEDGVTKHFDTMDGKAALAFSRMRYADGEGDYGRQARQRLVLEAIMHKVAKNPQLLLSADFLDAMADSAQTDLTFGNMTTLGLKYNSALGKLTSDFVQGKGQMLSSGSTEVVSREEQQRVTDVIREGLGLEAKTTGNLYGGEVSVAEMQAAGVPTE